MKINSAKADSNAQIAFLKRRPVNPAGTGSMAGGRNVAPIATPPVPPGIQKPNGRPADVAGVSTHLQVLSVPQTLVPDATIGDTVSFTVQNIDNGQVLLSDPTVLKAAPPGQGMS